MPGGRIEIQDSQLPTGAEAEILVTLEEPAGAESPGKFEPDPNARPFWERIMELLVEDLRRDPQIMILGQSSLQFQDALLLYAARRPAFRLS